MYIIIFVLYYFRSNHVAVNKRRFEENVKQKEEKANIDDVLDLNEDPDHIDVFYQEVDKEKLDEKIAGLNIEQRAIYDFVIGQMEEQETRRRIHGCIKYKPCWQCDSEENTFKLFITGKGKVMNLNINYISL